jgi:hypothetical protein
VQFGRTSFRNEAENRAEVRYQVGHRRNLVKRANGIGIGFDRLIASGEGRPTAKTTSSLELPQTITPRSLKRFHYHFKATLKLKVYMEKKSQQIVATFVRLASCDLSTVVYGSERLALKTNNQMETNQSDKERFLKMVGSRLVKGDDR